MPSYRPATSTYPASLALRQLDHPRVRQRRAGRRQVKRRASPRHPLRAAPPAPRESPAPAAPPASPCPVRRRTAGRRRSGGCPSRNRADSTSRAATSPRSCARPVTPNAAACATISGNSVTTSIRMPAATRARIHADPLVIRSASRRRSAGRRRSTRVDVRGDVRNQPLRRPLVRRRAAPDARRSPARPPPVRALRPADSPRRDRRGRPSTPRRPRRARAPARGTPTSPPAARRPLRVSTSPAKRATSGTCASLRLDVDVAPRSPGRPADRTTRDARAASPGPAVDGGTLSHPCTPYGAAIRPITTTIASARRRTRQVRWGARRRGRRRGVRGFAAWQRRRADEPRDRVGQLARRAPASR